MKRLLTLLAIALPLCAAAQTTRTINFESLAFEIAETSKGAALDSSFQFQIGSFGSFTPTATNVADWGANFQSLGQSAWDDVFSSFSGSVALASNAGGFSTVSSAYVWGFNTKSIGTGAEWVLLTNPTWTFPDTSVAIGFPVTFTADIANGTSAILGSLGASGSDPYMMTSPVPEPSTYAAILGSMVLGLVGYRRYRRK